MSERRSGLSRRAVALLTTALMVAGFVSYAGATSAEAPVASPRISVGPDMVVGEKPGTSTCP